MTKKELQQIFYLNKEIEMWKKELDEPKYDLSVQSPNYKKHGTGSKNISNKTAEDYSVICRCSFNACCKTPEKLIWADSAF
jgi:hypothetical protein